MIALYVHVPFCHSKCSYCGFFSTLYDEHLASNVIAAILMEIEQRRDEWAERTIVSVYLGGGTPTTLSTELLERLFLQLQRHLPLKGDAEFTVEMNPASVTESKCAALTDLGITRASIGVQAFSDIVLTRLGRRHTSAEAEEAFRTVRRSGMRSIGIDLLYGVPGQTPSEWQETVERALALRPDHLSCYALSVEPGTKLAGDLSAGKAVMPDDEMVAEMYELLQVRAQETGYGQYELSNFALPSHECRHNLHYWDRGEFLGFGPSASSFVRGRRWSNVCSVERYLDRIGRGISACEEEERISIEQAASEYLFLGLRRTSGIDIPEYLARYGSQVGTAFTAKVRALGDAGLVKQDGHNLRLTFRGMLLSNEVFARLIP